jgi:hypothetical protein
MITLRSRWRALALGEALGMVRKKHMDRAAWILSHTLSVLVLLCCKCHKEHVLSSSPHGSILNWHGRSSTIVETLQVYAYK